MELISADRCELPAPKKHRKPESERITLWPRVGMTPKQHRKFEKLGGAKWVRGLIDEAKP